MGNVRALQGSHVVLALEPFLRNRLANRCRRRCQQTQSVAQLWLPIGEITSFNETVTIIWMAGAF